MPSTAARHHQLPWGSRRVSVSNSRPAGRARSSPASSGRSGGSNAVVTRYVVPQIAGPSAVSSTSPGLAAAAAAFFTQRGLQHWETDMLFTLRRAGTPLSAGALLRSAMVTSGAITNRIDRLEARELVERIRDTEDRRSVLIRLTQRGRDLVDGVLAEHLANERRILAGLTTEERESLSALLRTTLEHLGDTSLG
jgi:DNA-binding MarR family transcriptional regulator